jgi:hypothetical protein
MGTPVLGFKQNLKWWTMNRFLLINAEKGRDGFLPLEETG